VDDVGLFDSKCGSVVALSLPKNRFGRVNRGDLQSEVFSHRAIDNATVRCELNRY
jgi:hypothetical protein